MQVRYGVTKWFTRTKSEFRVTTEINEATVTIKSRIYYKLKKVFGRIYMLLSLATLT